MNPIVIDGKRKRILPPARARARRAAALDRLIGSLQERFGYGRERAQRELKRRVARHHAREIAR